MKYVIRLLIIVAVSLLAYAMTAPWPQQSEHEAAEKQAAGTDKPHAGIEMHYYSPQPVKVGEALSLELSFTLDQQAENLVLTIEVEPGLQLDSPERLEFTAVSKAMTSLQVSALEQGRFHITVNAVISNQGQSQARSFVIPVTVQGESTDQAGAKSAAPRGQKIDATEGVVSMPAQESSH